MTAPRNECGESSGGREASLEAALLAELEDRQLLVGEVLRTSGDAEVSDGFQGDVQAARLSMGAYLRRRALGQRVRIAAELRLGAAELRELNRIGVNLNQMALGSPAAFTINPDWTAFSVSKIPSITFFFPPNNASGPPACRLLKGGS